MNWEEIGAIGHVLGSIAIFIMLWYLAMLTRDSARAVEADRARSRQCHQRELFPRARFGANLSEGQCWAMSRSLCKLN